MSELLDQAEARAILDVLPGLRWRPFTRVDLPVIAAFYQVCERVDENPERTSQTDLEEFFDSPRSVPELDTLVGFDVQGAVMATAWAGCNRAITEKRGVHLRGAVHPNRRREGIGRAVLGWELAHGGDWDEQSREPAHGPLVMRMLVPTAQSDVRDLAVRHGLPVERFFFEMSQRLTGPVSVPVLEGIRLLDWEQERADDVLVLLNSAFREGWGHVDATQQMWQEQLASHTFRPDWSVLAVEENTGEVVGVAFNVAYEQDWVPHGYTEG